MATIHQVMQGLQIGPTNVGTPQWNLTADRTRRHTRPVRLALRPPAPFRRIVLQASTLPALDEGHVPVAVVVVIEPNRGTIGYMTLTLILASLPA
jgi:hypothetical protein